MDNRSRLQRRIVSEKGRNFPAILGQTLGAVAHDTAKINSVKILTGIGACPPERVLTVSTVSEGKIPHGPPSETPSLPLPTFSTIPHPSWPQDGQGGTGEIDAGHLIRVAYTPVHYRAPSLPLTGILRNQFTQTGRGFTFLSHHYCCYLHLLNLPFSDLFVPSYH